MSRGKGVNGIHGSCRSLDAALVSPGEPTPFPNVRHEPELAHGLAFNLANNIWGTNYVMWQPYVREGATMRFRFRLAAGPAAGMRMRALGSPWWPQQQLGSDSSRLHEAQQTRDASLVAAS